LNINRQFLFFCDGLLDIRFPVEKDFRFHFCARGELSGLLFQAFDFPFEFGIAFLQLLDRALKFETGYAGRSWFLRDLKDNQLGQRVGSDLVTAFSDPTIDGFGHYMYDDEGTPAHRIYHFDKGIFNGFSNSRQTAAITDAAPNGHYKATDASFVPLIRMSNTAFAPGDRDPSDIIREVKDGYYVVGHRIPSIAESRENFRITAMKVYEIKNGEIGEMFRDGGLTSDSRDYFMNVDAVGNDFRLFAIPNCGKGQPMQTKRMGNGGPTMRSRARLTGK